MNITLRQIKVWKDAFTVNHEKHTVKAGLIMEAVVVVKDDPAALDATLKLRESDEDEWEEWSVDWNAERATTSYKQDLSYETAEELSDLRLRWAKVVAHRSVPVEERVYTRWTAQRKLPGLEPGGGELI